MGHTFPFMLWWPACRNTASPGCVLSGTSESGLCSQQPPPFIISPLYTRPLRTILTRAEAISRENPNKENTSQ